MQKKKEREGPGFLDVFVVYTAWHPCKKALHAEHLSGPQPAKKRSKSFNSAPKLAIFSSSLTSQRSFCEMMRFEHGVMNGQLEGCMDLLEGSTALYLEARPKSSAPVQERLFSGLSASEVKFPPWDASRSNGNYHLNSIKCAQSKKHH